MSWQPSSLGFAPNAPAANGGFDAMSMWGQPAGGDQPFDMSGMDPWQKFQANAMMESQALQRQGLDVARQGAAPPSPWATGAQTFGTVAQGLAGLANIYLGYQGMKQQKKAFEFNKNVVNTNLGNSISDYNRRLNDTLQNRALNNGQGSGWVSQQLAQYSAKRAP